MAVSRLNQTTLQNGFEKYNQLWDGRSAVGSMEAISSITLSAAQATVEFNNIPQTYSHLQIRAFFTNSTAAACWSNIIVNNDITAGNYKFHELYSNGTTVGSVAPGPASYGYLFALSSSSTNFTGSIVELLDYTSTNKNKTFRTLTGYDENGSGYMELTSGVWLNSSSAVTSFYFKVDGVGNFKQYSSFSLYGIK